MRIPSIQKSTVSIYPLNSDMNYHFRFIIDHISASLQISQTGYDDHASICQVAKGLTVEGILENWSKLKPVIMEEWAENRDDLVDLFGKVRDEWMEKDLATWVSANR